jgi:hypothetical protein
MFPGSTGVALTLPGPKQGCQMVCFQTKNPILGKFWMVLQWKILVYFMTIWSILLQLEIFFSIWYILWSFDIFFPDLVFCTKKNLATLGQRSIAVICDGYVRFS